jgi:hypothetical protein
MKVEFGTTLKNIDGNEMREPKMDPHRLDENGRPLPVMGEDGVAVMEDVTLLKICKIVLMGSFEDEKNLAGDKKLERWTLAQKINGGNTEVVAEDVTLLKLLIGKGFGPRVLGPAYLVLEGGE